MQQGLTGAPAPALPQHMLISPLEAERMARREWQDPSVLTRAGARGEEYYIRYRVKVLTVKDGKPVITRKEKWAHLGLASEMTKRQAERKKDEIMRQVNGQVYTVQSQVPFRDLLEAFLENHVPKLKGPSQNQYRQHVKLYIRPAFETSRVCDVGTLQLEQLFAAMEARGLSKNTRKGCKGILKAIFGCAKKWGYITGPSPVKDADVGGGPSAARPYRVPSLDDVRRLMAACEGDVPLLMETLYVTGMRISEAAGLLVNGLDFEQGAAYVTQRNCRGDVDETKSDAGRRRLGLGDVKEKLAEHVAGKKPTDNVFTWRGAPIVDNLLLANYVSPIMEKLGIKFPGFGWHAFRRLHITLMNRNGLTLHELRHQAGHADVRTTQRYVVDDLDRRAEAANGLPKLKLVKKPA